MTEYPLDASCDMVHNEMREHFWHEKCSFDVRNRARDVHLPRAACAMECLRSFRRGDGEASRGKPQRAGEVCGKARPARALHRKWRRSSSPVK